MTIISDILSSFSENEFSTSPERF